MDDPSSPSSPLDATPELPRREGNNIPAVVSGPYDVATHHWQLTPPQDQLIVVVKGSYDVVPDGPARRRETANFITGERFYGDDPTASAVYPDDLAIFKPKADVVMVGHAYPLQPSAVATRVTFAFGSPENRFERSINVYGDRVWRRGIVKTAGDVQPFDKIPLVYERAFGGPKLAANPVGRGYRDSDLMPNLELPDTMVTRPDKKYRPACFAPIAMEWSERWKRMGTYDRSWFKKRWPYFPEDFDWAFFQAAPPEQRLDYLRGDEPFEVTSVSPELAAIKGRLAGEHARAFILKRGDSSQLHELKLRLDTVSFDFDAMSIDVVWRGLFDVSGKDAPDVQAIFAMAEPVDAEPRSLEQIWQLFLETLDKPEEEEQEASPQTVEEPTEAQQQAEAERRDKIAELEARAASYEQDLQEAIKAANLPPDFLDREPPAADPEQLAASLAPADATPAERDALKRALSPDEEEEQAPGDEPLPLRERVIAKLHAKESFAGFDFEEDDLSDLDFSGCELTEARLQNAVFRRASFEGANLSGAQMGKGDFTEARFSSADLTGADLTAATVVRASFERANLTGVELCDAVGREADFSGASGEGIFFSGGTWQRAVFDGVDMTAANFSGATLSGCTFYEAKLDKVNLRDVHGPDVKFDRSRMVAIRGDDCKMHRCSLHAVEAPESVFENAELLEADLSHANLNGATFLRATCLRADFSQSELSESNFRFAKLAGASFRQANLMMSALDDADLTLADLRDSNLYGCALVDTNLEHAELGGANTAKSSLVMKPFRS